MIEADKLKKTIQKIAEPNEETTKMAVVTNVLNGKVYLKFYGETEASLKPYKRIASYNPTVGDTVVLTKVGSSYLITGKVV